MIKISHYLPKSVANGPGTRFTIWFQGCRFHCSGCFNPQLQDFSGGIAVDSNDLLQQIKAVESIDGVTYSGGEPFEQAAELIELTKSIRKLNLSVFCYTGYTLAELQNCNDLYKKEMLSLIDILAAGRYENRITANCNYIGSANQQIYIFNPLFLSQFDQDDLVNKSEIIIDDCGNVVLTGFPDEQIKMIVESTG